MNATGDYGNLEACRPGYGKGDGVRNFRLTGDRAKDAVIRNLWRERRLHGGLRVSVLDAALSGELSFSYSKDNPFIEFGFFLEGGVINEMRETPIGSATLENRAGERGVGFLRRMSGAVTIPGGKRTRLLHLHILPEVLGAMLGQDAAHVPAELKKALQRNGNADFINRRAMSPNLQAAANALFYGVRDNSGMRLYLEGKTLELLGLSLMEREEDETGAPSLCPGERDAVRAIRRELEREFASPPTLAELSARRRMAVHKIQAGFREMYGTSVFGFVREHRLQTARLLFEEGDKNVSEAAWAVGYVNLSHFSEAYKKRFGVLPRDYLKSVRAKSRRPASNPA